MHHDVTSHLRMLKLGVREILGVFVIFSEQLDFAPFLFVNFVSCFFCIGASVKKAEQQTHKKRSTIGTALNKQKRPLFSY